MRAADEAHLVAVGVSHRTAPVEVRERLAMDEAGVRGELTWLRESGLVREAMVISTCNRVELYVVPEQGGDAPLRDYLSQRRGIGPQLEGHLFWRRGREAVRHLFRVASSLDSLVVGEPQILGQVKDAVRIAEEAQALGPVLHRLTQKTLWVAKHVRTHTDIGRHAVGIGNAGVWLSQQIFSSLKGRRALLVGTGEMGRQVATAMVGAGLSELIVTNRTFAAAVEVAEAFGGTPIPFDRMVEYLQRVDVVITATGAYRPILSAEDVRGALRARRQRPLFFVDLAVPRNVDPDVHALDNAYLFNVDDLTQVVERNREKREEAGQAAEAIISSEADRFAERLSALEVDEAIGRVSRKAEALRLAELERSRRLIDGLSADQQLALDALTRALVKKLLHGPFHAVRRAGREGDEARVHAITTAWDEPGEGG